MTRTPTPWKIDINYDVFIETSDGLTTICTVGDPGRPEQGEHDAQFIIRACNAHEELVKALQECVEQLEMIPFYEKTNSDIAAVNNAKRALAHAEKGA